MKKIALAFPVGVDHLAQVAFGIRKFSREFTNWQLITNPERHRLEVHELRGWDGDGVISQINTKEEADILHELGIPCVNLSGVLKNSPIPRVRADYYQMGMLGAEHFLTRGFDNFAFYGIKNVWYSKEIARGYNDRLSSHGKKLQCFEALSGISGHWTASNDKLQNWLTTLPRPCALMAAHDPRALEALQSCQSAGLKIPEDISILGTNNDIVSCELVSPSLSSIPRRGEDVGFEAAKMLDAILHGKKPESNEVIIPVDKAIDRESSAMLSVKNPELLKIIEYIRRNISNQINVGSICDASQKSRRWLEVIFQKELNQSPLEFIARTRVAQAREILESGENHKLSAVAYMAGFNSTNQMNKAFIKFYQNPAKFYRNP